MWAVQGRTEARSKKQRGTHGRSGRTLRAMVSISEATVRREATGRYMQRRGWWVGEDHWLLGKKNKDNDRIKIKDKS